jgi:hypothetical protein
MNVFPNICNKDFKCDTLAILLPIAKNFSALNILARILAAKQKKK